jgi:predicted ATPase
MGRKIYFIIAAVCLATAASIAAAEQRRGGRKEAALRPQSSRAPEAVKKSDATPCYGWWPAAANCTSMPSGSSK